MAVPEPLKQQRAGRNGDENADEGQRPRPSQRRPVDADGGLRDVRRDEEGRGEGAAAKVPAHRDQAQIGPHAEEHRSANRAQMFLWTWLCCDTSRSISAFTRVFDALWAILILR